MNRIGIAAFAAAAVLSVAGTSVLADDGRGPPPAPPPEAFQACQSLAEGAACTVTHGDHQMAGTCRSGPDGGALACAPARPHGPPPEAFQACQSLAEGATCTVSMHGRSMTGTCRSGPDGGTLACAPPRPPGR
jgi:hypothetical protein